MSQTRIKLLPDHIANQIAAGEVVQRPASVVKELMENAIDAQATDIKLIVKDAGKTLIQVVDDGIGMNETDARMAFERHATSKISTADDLFHINTKGFRGEALASIAAVAHVEIKTKPEDAELGTYIKIEGSKVIEQKPVATQKGTSIAVKNLFFNIPARRKFLKSIQVEMRHINDEFYRLALAHPDISFSLIHNGNIVFQLPKSNLLQRISNTFSSKLKERLVPVKEETEYIKISGYIGKPEFTKLKRGEQFFFVNGRFIKSPYLNHALISAYEGLIKEKSYPSYFVYFEIDPKHIDVNIHPTKTEIKFDDEQTVYSILKVAAKHSLGQFNLSPSMDFENKPELDVPYEYQKKTPKTPPINVNPDFNPFQEDDFGIPAKTPRKHFEKKVAYWESLMNETKDLAQNIPNQPAENQSIDRFETNQTDFSGFQIQNKFIVSHYRGKLIVVHQNKAHQSIVYHQLLKQLKQGHIASQQLIFPIEIALSKTEINLLQNKEELIQTMGFDIQFKPERILINGIPLAQQTQDVTRIFQELIDYLAQDIPVEKDILEKKIAMLIAEKSSIKSGNKLQEAEIQQLLKDLFALPEPQYSPQGKKVFFILSENEIMRKFDL